MRWSGTVVGVLSLAAVLAYVLHEAEQPAPGPLHPSHAGVAELAECGACHVEDASWRVACGRCHEPVETQLRRGDGLHGQLGAAAAECVRCHVEHHGAPVPLVGEASFVAAGAPSRSAFDHGRDAALEFALAGRHDALECGACHDLADAPALAAGSRRFLGLDQACGTCHDDTHDGAFGARCEGCHGQDAPFAEATSLDHSRFPLVDSHATLDCSACHAEGPPDPSSRAAVRECAACHESPHGGAPLYLRHADDCGRCHDMRSFAGTPYGPGEHAAGGVPLLGGHAEAPCAGCHVEGRLAGDLQRCVACHEDVHASGDGRPGVPAWSGRADCAACHEEAGFRPATATGADHARFGAALAPAHEPLPCAACHDSTQVPAGAAECAACHASPHDAGFVGGVACVDCHATADAAFADAGGRLTPEQHASMPLYGPHDVVCAACHEPGPAFDARYPGRAADDCAACHGDAHEGGFAGGAFAEAACSECHAPARFVPSTFDVAQHARARFALDGAHAAVPCARCHEGQGARRRFAGVSTACAACHPDPHDGVFDRDGLPAAVAGRAGCARCHDTRRFRDAGAAFDHGRWTGRQLLGAHARAGCGRCHERRRDGGLAPAPAACSACHADPHRGQLRRAESTDCGRCHDERESFAELRFDHDHDTRFALDEHHARLACSACHRPVALSGGETVIHYRPLGTACRDCHLPRTGGGRDR